MYKRQAENLKQICEAVTATTQASFKLQFDPTLVRGMSYYTGTVSYTHLDVYKRQGV